MTSHASKSGGLVLKEPPLLHMLSNTKNAGLEVSEYKKKPRKSGTNTEEIIRQSKKFKFINNFKICWLLMPDSQFQDLRGFPADNPRQPPAFSDDLSLHERFIEATITSYIFLPINQKIVSKSLKKKKRKDTQLIFPVNQDKSIFSLKQIIFCLWDESTSKYNLLITWFPSFYKCYRSVYAVYRETQLHHT